MAELKATFDEPAIVSSIDISNLEMNDPAENVRSSLL
jgi:hypothetical protein